MKLEVHSYLDQIEASSPTVIALRLHPGGFDLGSTWNQLSKQIRSEKTRSSVREELLDLNDLAATWQFAANNMDLPRCNLLSDTKWLLDNLWRTRSLAIGLVGRQALDVALDVARVAGDDTVEIDGGHQLIFVQTWSRSWYERNSPLRRLPEVRLELLPVF
jgi:hypothetical protein